MLGISDTDFKAAVMKMLSQSSTDFPKMNGKKPKNRKSQQRKRS